MQAERQKHEYINGTLIEKETSTHQLYSNRERKANCTLERIYTPEAIDLEEEETIKASMHKHDQSHNGCKHKSVG